MRPCAILAILTILATSASAEEARRINGTISVSIPSKNHFNINVGYLLPPSIIQLRITPDPGCTIDGGLINPDPAGWYGWLPIFTHYAINDAAVGVHEGVFKGTFHCEGGGTGTGPSDNKWDGKIKDVVCTTTWTWDQCPTEYRKQNSNYSPPAQVNGCGSDASGNFPHIAPGGADFGPACASHDIGYSTCNSDKSQVDFKFLFDMLAACSGVSDPNLKQDCEVVARGYYIAVDTGGESAYREAQIAACVCCKP